MIGVLLDGRMGNQLFQFAFVYCASKKLNTSYFTYNKSRLSYFELSPEFEKINNSNRIKYAIRNCLTSSTIPFIKPFYKLNSQFLIKRGVHKNVIDWPNVIEGNVFLLKKYVNNSVYKGYFQCEDYFKDYRAEILKLFNLKKEFRSGFKTKKKYLIDKPYIAIHMRRGDYIEHGGEEIGGFDMTLPITYYRNCLKDIGDTKMPIVFVSDDINFVKNEFGDKENYFFESNDEITDFQILLNAHTVVIANSSFSWWAAWLNNQADKIVYAPKYYLGFKIKKYYPAGIMVKDWNWMEVN